MSHPPHSIMGTATAQSTRHARPLTIDELPYFVGDRPGELVRGEFIEMAPTGERHAEIEAILAREIEAILAREIGNFVKKQGIGKVLCGEIGIITGRDPDTVRGADVAFLSSERLGQRTNVSGYLDVAPDLIVEIISPNDRWTDVQDKLEEYFAIGVDTVWLVNPKRREVTVYRSPTDATLLSVSATLTGRAILPGFEVPVAELFPD